MEVVKQLIPLVFTVSLAGIVVSIGAQSTIDDLLYLVRRPLSLLKAVLAVNVIVPIAAAVLIALFPAISPPAKAGIMLMAISPVPPLAPGNEMKVGARKEYAYGLYVALIALAVVIVPLSVAILDRYYPVELTMPPGALLRSVALTVLLPLLAGLALRRVAPAFAERAAPIIEKIAMILVVLAFLLMLTAMAPAMLGLIGNGAILVVVLVVAVALVASHLLAGPDPRDKGALAMAASTRHPGIAMMIAGANFQDPRITAAILGFLVVGMLATLPYKAWMKKRAPAMQA